VTGSLSINANGGTLVVVPWFAWRAEQVVGVAKKRLKSGDCHYLNLDAPSGFAMCHLERSHKVIAVTVC
jgi:hypothetical protein